MKRTAATALALALTAAAGSAAIAAQDYYGGDRYDNRAYQYDTRYARDYSRTDVAQVVRAVPMADPYASYQRQECWNERTSAYDDGYYRDGSGRLYYRGDSNADGTLVGGVVGGALGNLAGKGDGRKAATIGGAVIGAIIGNNIDRNNGSRDGQYQYRDQAGTVRRCRTVTDYDAQDRWSGYDVTYRYGGRTYRAVTNYRPGPTIRVAVEVRPIDEGVAYRR